jgi:hypothetical protein
MKWEILDETFCLSLLITEAYCLQLQDSLQDCNISLLSVDHHPILLQHLYIFVQNGWWVRLRLKIGSFVHKVPVGSILFSLIEGPVSAQDWFRHRDKTRVQTPAIMFPHLKLLCQLFMGPTLGFDTKQRNSF